jgi:nucleoside-diphosphate-sugar epimerase
MPIANEDRLVLVTGATGFVAMHIILKLLESGYRVRGTVRDLARAPELTATLRRHAEVRDRFTVVQADLGADDGWAEAAAGCTFVLHVASPVLAGPPAHPDDVIVPARDGTLRVLRAAADAGVGRVVLTSSLAAVLYGHPRHGEKTFDESDWSIEDDTMGAYERSKTVAERAAWEFVSRGRMELVTLQPGLVLGPVLGKDYSVSGELVRKLMMREFPGCPDLGWAVVDVRDLAQAHVVAMTEPRAAGQRFIVAIEHVPMTEIARVLNSHYRPRGYKVPMRRVPNFLLRVVALWDKTVALTVHDLGKRMDVSSKRARDVLGYEPRGVEAMVVDMAESMIACGVIPAIGPRTAAVASS